MMYRIEDFAQYEKRGEEIRAARHQRPPQAEHDGKKVSEGRNNFLFRSACLLIGKGFSRSAVEVAIKQQNLDECDPPLDDSEIDGTIMRAYERYPRGTQDIGAPAEPTERAPSSLRMALLTGSDLSGLEVHEPEPLVRSFAYRGYVTLFVGRAFEGKTTFALNAARCIAMGCPPWPGAQEPEPAHVIFLCPDDAAASLKKRLRDLDLVHPVQRCVDTPWDEHLHVLALHPDIDTALFDDIRLTDFGLGTIAATLEDFERENQNVAMLVLDAYADFLPPGEGENSNEAASKVMGGLQRLATQYDVAIVVIHHVGKPGDRGRTDDPDVVTAARGASAITAKARMVTVMSRPSRGSHIRELISKSNFTAQLSPLAFEVRALEDEEDSVVFFKPAGHGASTNPRDVMEPGLKYSKRKLAKLLGDDEGDGDPSGYAKRLARRKIDEWSRAGLITQQRNAQGHWEYMLSGAAEDEKEKDDEEDFF